MRWTTSVEEWNELIDDVVVDRALQEFLDELAEPYIIFHGFLFVFLRTCDACEGRCGFFALLFALLCDFSREIETVQTIISRIEGHI